MMYGEVVRDFATRTRINLELVRSHCDELPTDTDGARGYEVTQLINSMLGLLVFPQQGYIDLIPKTPLQELEEQGWPKIRPSGEFAPVSDLNTLVRYLRNAISHFNLEFLESGGQISGVRVWNIAPRKKERNWEAELTIEELEDITTRFLEMLDQYPKTGAA